MDDDLNVLNFFNIFNYSMISTFMVIMAHAAARCTQHELVT